jgi:hypothetical protein
MNQVCQDLSRSFIPDNQSAKLLKPGIGSFDDPTVLISSQFSSILMTGDPVVTKRRNDGSIPRLTSKARSLLLPQARSATSRLGFPYLCFPIFTLLLSNIASASVTSEGTPSPRVFRAEYLRHRPILFALFPCRI